MDAGVVMCHPFVIGELACGHLPAREPLLSRLARLPMALMVRHSEVLAYVERHALMGRGIGWIDVHLLASAAVGGHVPLWSRDKRLAAVAADPGVGIRANSALRRFAA